MYLSEELKNKLICPVTKTPLQQQQDYLVSVSEPPLRYPLIDGIPVLINEANSLFTIENFINREDTTFKLNLSKIKQRINALIPNIGHNLKATDNYRELIRLLPADAKILVVGGGITGRGMEKFYEQKSYEIVGSDVYVGSRTTIISDAHDIPFEQDVFDCVIVQAVLEHVLDPQRCVAEMHRVLKSEGLIYAETPFMQQVHMRQYDFTRFTHLGHRRLFRYFTEIDSGPTGGPAMALAWSWMYFLRSFTSSLRVSKLLEVLGRLTSFFFKYFDYLLIDKPGSYDAASGMYFMGRKNDKSLSDKELLKQFKGI